MKKLILILTILTLALSCSGDGLGGDSIALYDFTAYVDTTIDDIKTDTGKIIHTRESTLILKESYSISVGTLAGLKDRYPERVVIKNIVYQGNLTIRTTKKYYYKFIRR